MNQKYCDNCQKKIADELSYDSLQDQQWVKLRVRNMKHFNTEVSPGSWDIEICCECYGNIKLHMVTEEYELALGNRTINVPRFRFPIRHTPSGQLAEIQSLIPKESRGGGK